MGIGLTIMKPTAEIDAQRYLTRALLTVMDNEKPELTI